MIYNTGTFVIELIRNNVQGNVAELGVYKGEFAKMLNQLFSDRKLYLFDTCEGFRQNDISAEKQNHFSSGEQDFSDTSVELVLGKMKYPQNCIVKKGYFPESAADVDDRFCFLSLDADLYKPLLSGLQFFIPGRKIKATYLCTILITIFIKAPARLW